MAGYSGTLLAAKLGIRPGTLLHVINPPVDLDSQTPVWVSWPKKSARQATDITEDTIREVALPLGYVDIKVCSVSETWSGLKLVVRKELR